MILWIECKKELPPYDGLYRVTNDPENEMGIRGVAKYDGYGFIYQNHYVTPDYWAFYTPEEKKYGKQ